MRSIRALALAASGLLLAACGSIHNTISEGEDDQLMLRGMDPVAYFEEDTAIPGMPDLKTRHNGLTYRFATEDNLETFKRDPDHYVPRYAGFCASGLPYALKAKIGANVFAVVDDKLYMFGSDRARRHWLMDAESNIEIGDRHWENEVKDAYHRIQNYKRYIFKTDNYKTDEELEAEYLKRKAEGSLPPGI